MLFKSEDMDPPHFGAVAGIREGFSSSQKCSQPSSVFWYR